MVFDFTNPIHVSVDQIGMVEDIISIIRTSEQEHCTASPTAAHRSFAERLKKASSTHPSSTLPLRCLYRFPFPDDALKAIFHPAVAKLIFISNRSRQDILTTLSFLSRRVLYPTKEDWQKLARALQYLGETKQWKLLIGCIKAHQVHTSIPSVFILPDVPTQG